MELDFRHSELFANPIHLLAIHLYEQYGYLVKTSTEDTCLLHLKSIYVILYHDKSDPFQRSDTRNWTNHVSGARFLLSQSP
jgi:hypothetical protein